MSRTVTGYSQVLVLECARAAKEAFRRMTSAAGYGGTFYLYFKPNGLTLHVVGEDETAEGLELAMPERIPGNLTETQLSARFHTAAVRLPLLPVDQ